jgi:hypothetical protein
MVFHLYGVGKTTFRAKVTKRVKKYLAV